MLQVYVQKILFKYYSDFYLHDEFKLPSIGILFPGGNFSGHISTVDLF